MMMMLKRLSVFLWLCTSLPLNANAAEQSVAGFHLGSYHSPARDYNNFNPGVYLREPDGLQFGIFRNSFERTSLYGAQLFSYKYADVLVGLATGYPQNKLGLMPMLGLSKALKITEGSALRTTLLPARSGGKTGFVAHVTLEFTLKD
jgi:hypothetical protein